MDVILTANYLINRLPSAKLENKNPLKILYERKINIDHLRTFDCVSFVKIKRKNKLNYNSTKIIFLRYSSQQNIYKYYDHINKKTFISRNVIFFVKMDAILRKKGTSKDSYTND